MDKKTTVILGAGMMGLCAADELARRSDQRIILLEKEEESGGLCRGVQIRDQIFDYGPHAFWTKLQSSFDYCQRICGDDLLDVGLKDVRIFFRGTEYPYPLRMGTTLLRLDKKESLACIFDFAKVYIRNLFWQPKCASFEDHIKNYFGKTLYNIFFRDYTTKVWGIPPTQLAASFAAERIPKIKLSKALLDTLLLFGKKRNITQQAGKYLPSHLYYPKYGFRGFVQQLTKMISSKVEIHLNTSVSKVTPLENGKVKVEYGNHSIECDYLVSSLPVNTTVRLMDPSLTEVQNAMNGLQFRKISLVFLVIKKPRVYDYQWVYYQDPSICMHRVYETKGFGTGVSPNPNETGLCVEVTNRENWDSETLVSRVIKDFEKLNLFQRADVLEVKHVDLPHAYPLYDLHYRAKVETLMSYLSQQKNIITTGRQGLFVYIDTDHCMEMARHIADHIVDKKPIDPLYSVIAAHG